MHRRGSKPEAGHQMQRHYPSPSHAKKHRSSIRLTSLVSIGIIIISVVSYAAWVTSAFSRRSSSSFAFRQRQSPPSLSLCGRLLATSPVGSSRGTGVFFARNYRASRGYNNFARRMSLSNTDATTTAKNGIATFLDSISATLSEKIKSTQTNASNDDGGAISIHMIMGNEAGDADSIISSLSLGYVLNVNQQSTSSSDKKAQLDEVVVPIVSVPRADISLRRDVVLLLDLAGISVENLLYLDDDIVVQHLLPSSSAESSSSSLTKTTLTLVDHNRIRSSLSHLSSLVTEIVDHHEDERSHENVTTDSGKRVIAFEDGHATVASTCTLVAERIFQGGHSSTSTTIPKIDGSLGLMLLGVILLDSVNMLPAAGKGTPRDEKAMQLILQNTDWASFNCDVTSSKRLPSSLVDASTLQKIFPNGTSCKPDRAALFEALSGAKNDPRFWMELSVMDCLRIDYKKFLVSGQSAESSIGLSSVLLEMDSLLSKDSFVDELTSFVASSDVGLFGILALKFEGGQPQRELLLTGPSPDIVDSFANYLLNHPDAAFLEITEREECMSDGTKNNSDNAPTIRVFKQGNGKGSRKQVAPILLGHAAAMNSKL